MRKKIKYIGYYDTHTNRRLMSPAAVNKMNYIASTLVELGYTVEIISCGVIADKSYKASRENLKQEIFVNYFRTFKRSNLKLINKFLRLYEIIKIFIYCLKNIKKNEKILVYHSLMNMKVISLAKKIKKFKITLEVEEIYADVLEDTKKRKKEINFLRNVEGYIFPTELLNKEINLDKKPYVIVHGTYNIQKKISQKVKDKKIHVVYAGTFDPYKGGAKQAIKASVFLPEEYHLHILGFGTNEEIKSLKELINEIQQKSKAKITYEGLKLGEEYISLLQSCHIGLSTQNPLAKFNDTSFPSKILSYLENGLRVVSIKIPVVETSDIKDYIYYYEEQTPKKIAEAIKAIKLSEEYNPNMIILALNNKFKRELKNKLLI